MTFVRTKLMIEQMRAGEEAIILLSAGEAVENVPRSVREYGHRVIELTPTGDAEPPRMYLLRIAKTS